MDEVEEEVGGKRRARTGEDGTGSSPEEDTRVDKNKEYKKEEEMLTGRESREGWKAGRGKYAVEEKGKGGGPKGEEV